MKINENQLMILYHTLIDSLSITDRANVFLYSRDQREKILNEIISTQSNELVEIGKIND